MNNKAKKKQEIGELAVNQNPLSEVGGDRFKEMKKIHEMEEAEIKYAISLRKENLQKMEQDEEMKNGASSGSPVLYCFCRKPESGYMLQCELCHEWYHATCLHIPKGKRIPGKDIGKESRFLCSACQRTRRPSLETVSALLLSLKKVPVTISEGSALHCLGERAVTWRNKAKEEIRNATAFLEAAKQQKRRVEDLKSHIKRWRQEANTSVGSNTTSMQAQLASSAGKLLQCSLKRDAVAIKI